MRQFGLVSRLKWNRPTQLLSLLLVVGLGYGAQVTGLAGGVTDDAQGCGQPGSAEFEAGMSALGVGPSVHNPLATLSGQSTIDPDEYYTLWRRMTIDLCERLPSLSEVNSIEAKINDGSPGLPDNYGDILRACLDSENFADSIGRWVNDFILPGKTPLKFHPLHWEKLTDPQEGEIYYWYGGGWGDCNPNSLSELEKIYDPYWANASDLLGETVYEDSDGKFIYGCTQDGISIGDTSLTATIAINGTKGRCYNSDKRFPCGCGPNMRWCIISSNFYRINGQGDKVEHAGHNTGGNWTIKEQVLMEPANLVKNIVLGNDGLLGQDVPFTDIFNADYVIRTSRLQQYYEIMQAKFDKRVKSDACFRIMNGLDKTNENCPTAMSGSVDYNHTDLTEEWDWQVIDLNQEANDQSTPLDYQAGGILTTWEFLARQPSEPNVAGLVYSFWACENVSWRGAGGSVDWPLDTGQNTVAGQNYSLLSRTTAANEAMDDTNNCRGCHLTVNPLAAFRSYWDHNGRYINHPDTEANGIFLGQTGSDMTGLGDLMADSRVVHSCIVNRSFERLTGKRLDNDSVRLVNLTESFSEHRNIKELYLSIIETPEYWRAR